ncbi:MAG: NAD(P)/FAD-dependent oxidoreductase, partial [Chitinophagales bacterium]|nr:NAD(P)/FAD-dependent oxidoreductase [Chitinophagales bacterium]
MKKFDVIVVGSGPAGSVAAYHLAQNGISTAVVEREKLPRYKTCGGGVTYRARKLFPVDISPIVEKEFYASDLVFPIEQLHFKVKRNRPIISMVMRDSLDHFLLKAAEAQGAIVLDETEVKAIDCNGKITLHTATDEALEARYVIAADGALSPVAKMCGWKDERHLIPALEYELTVPEHDFEKLSQTVRFDIDAIPYGYAWNFPKKKHLSIGVASAKRGKVNLHEYYRKYLTTLGVTEIIHEEKHGYQIPLSPRKDGFSKSGVLLTGDAAGFADPVTAEGISNSALSGRIAAEAIIASLPYPHKLDELYSNKLKESLLPQLKLGRFLADIFYDKTWIRKPLFHRYGQPLCEALTDVFMGERDYPHDAMKRAGKYLKE